MTTFSKYSILPSELRNHVLSYNDRSTLGKYAHCSKTCNADVQIQYIEGLQWIILHEAANVMTVELNYKRSNLFYYNLQFSKANNDSHFLGFNYNVERGTACKGNYKQAAVDYVKNRLNYNGNGKCSHVTIYTYSFWPFNLRDMTKIGRNCLWEIKLHEPMFQGFYDCIKNGEFENIRFRVTNTTKDHIKIPKDFFKTSFFENLSEFSCNILDVDDFLAIKTPSISIDCSSFSDEVINQKLCQHFENSEDKRQVYNFFRENKLKFDRNVVMKKLSVTDSYMRKDDDEIITVKHASGAEKMLSFREDRIYLFK